MGIMHWTIIGLIKGDTRSLDYSSHVDTAKFWDLGLRV